MKSTNNIETPEFLTEKAVRELLEISRTTLWRLRKRHNIPFYRIEGAKRVYYRKQDVYDALKRSYTNESR